MPDHESHLGDFDVLRCEKCGLGLTDPYPSQETSAALYESKSSSDFDVVQDSVIDVIKDVLSRRQIAKLTAGRSVRSVLDFSTGNGRFALAAAVVLPSATVHAVDFQDAAPPLLTPGGRVRYFSIEEFNSSVSEKYDLIILRHVLEHTYDPVALLELLAAHLEPRGRMYVEVPNLDSGCARVFGRYWKGFYVPRHIFHFTKGSLSSAICAAGLQCEIAGNEMPMMGNTVAILTGANQGNLFIQLLGIVLHPVQLAIEAWFRSSTCINAICRIQTVKEE